MVTRVNDMQGLRLGAGDRKYSGMCMSVSFNYWSTRYDLHGSISDCTEPSKCEVLQEQGSFINSAGWIPYLRMTALYSKFGIPGNIHHDSRVLSFLFPRKCEAAFLNGTELFLSRPKFVRIVAVYGWNNIRYSIV